MRVLFLLLSLLLLRQSPVSAGDCLNIGVMAGGLSSAAIGHITESLFLHAGSCAVIVNLSQSRLNQIENQDTLDGEALRVASYLDSRPYLMMVPTPVTHFSGNLYWPPGHPAPSGPNTVIGVVAGQIWPKQAAQQRKADISELSSYDDMLAQTKSGRLQGFMMAAEAFRHFAAQDEEIARYNTETVIEMPLYLVINRRHKALLPKLDEGVSALSANGYIAQQLDHSSQ